MDSLAHQRCFHHKYREAAARCPSCNRYFCRECVTEHEDRVLCTACLAKVLGSSETGRPHFAAVFCILQFLCGAMIVWIFFYFLGQLLLELPTPFHEGTLWQKP